MDQLFQSKNKNEKKYRQESSTLTKHASELEITTRLNHDSLSSDSINTIVEHSPEESASEIQKDKISEMDITDLISFTSDAVQDIQTEKETLNSKTTSETTMSKNEMSMLYSSEEWAKSDHQSDHQEACFENLIDTPLEALPLVQINEISSSSEKSTVELKETSTSTHSTIAFEKLNRILSENGEVHLKCIKSYTSTAPYELNLKLGDLVKVSAVFEYNNWIHGYFEID
jgi:hypothetical protein